MILDRKKIQDLPEASIVRDPDFAVISQDGIMKKVSIENSGFSGKFTNEQTITLNNWITHGVPWDKTPIPLNTLEDGAVLSSTTGTNGVMSWMKLPSSGYEISTKTHTDSPLDAVSGNIYQCDTSVGILEINLPTGVENDYLEIWDFSGTFGETNKYVSVIPADGQNIDGQAIDETLRLDISNTRTSFIYTDGVRGWQIDIGYNSIGSGSNKTASSIINIPDGNISADNVQLAINELDQEKMAKVTPGNDGNVLTSNGSGAWVSEALPNKMDLVTPGATGNVLTSNGTIWESKIPKPSSDFLIAQVFS